MMYLYCPTHVCYDVSAMNQSNWMILGARESWWSLLYNESKNIKNLRLLFAGDDFEKICLQIIDEISLILLTFWDNISTSFLSIKKNKKISIVDLPGYNLHDFPRGVYIKVIIQCSSLKVYTHYPWYAHLGIERISSMQTVLCWQR